MVQVRRTATDLLTNLFQDGQADKAIVANRIRDFIDSMLMPVCSASIVGGTTETSIATPGTFVNLAGTWVAAAHVVDISINAAGGVLTYTGTPDRHFHIVSNVSFFTVGNNKEISFQWFKNGTTALPAPMERKVQSGGDIGSASIHSDALMTTGDTLELKVTNNTDATNLTVQDAYTFVMGMFV